MKVKNFKYKVFAIPVLLIVFVGNIIAQTVNNGSSAVLKTTSTYLSKDEFANKYELNTNVIKEFHSLEFDKKALKSANLFPLNIGTKDLVISRNRIVERGANDFSFVGDVEGTAFGKAIISIRNDNIVGIINTDETEYNIVTFGKNDYYLAKFDNSNSESCPTEGKEYYKKADNYYEETTMLSTKKSISNNVNPNVKAGSSNSCKMRVIALYTPAAEALTSDIRNLINNHMERANTYNSDAEVNEEWELAYAGLTNYTEAYVPGVDQRFTDRNRFRIDGDGFMDEVHDLRDTYSADVCILLTECQYVDSGWCGGVAAAIDAAPSTAFCLAHVVSWTIGSFEHEIGHLLGGGHPNDYSPYTYGHGTVNTANNWKTVMGIGFGMTRIHWSNPDKTYMGDPTGTTTWNDVGRVMEQEVPEKTRFYQPATNVTVSSADVNELNYGEIISEQTVTLGNITIENGSTLKVRTAETTLSNGFYVEQGAELEIINEAVYDCP